MSKLPTAASEESVRLPDVMPVLPLKNTVIFPYIILPLSVGRETSLKAVDRALAKDRLILLVSQRDALIDEPTAGELHKLGTAAIIMRMLKLPDGRIRILVQGLARAEVEHFGKTRPFLQAKIHPIEEIEGRGDPLEIEAMMRTVKDNLERVVNLGKQISPEVMILAANLDEPGRLADLAASNLALSGGDAQEILATLDPLQRLERVHRLLSREVELLTMQQEISLQARGEMDRSQREYYLRQQLKAIQDELGDGSEIAEEIAGYRQAANDKQMSAEAVTELQKQIHRLERSHPESAETAVIRTYLETLSGLPWTERSDDRLDLERARRILDEDHFGLEKVKERIIEFLAVRRLNPKKKGPILCFVGPPGVGKTSLGRSIARALGRQFARLSLGGVRDEAEIRGHRRTYVGAMPGRILQSIATAGKSNPVFMLDEIDKIGADFRGDPSSALLEVLDPEQNQSFRDHYLGVAYDLSPVLFITTANMLEPIQPAFLDRMEVIRLSGYTLGEKVEIAKRHLVPRQLADHGLGTRQLRFTDAAIRLIASDYTREAGLRNLEREIASVCRKAAVAVAEGKGSRQTVSIRTVADILGPRRHFTEELLGKDRLGVATGLAWTAAGGDLLFIEVLAVPGSGKLLLTGRLGEVMRESAQAAVSFARAHCKDQEGAGTFFNEHDLHIHVPAGSIPKDGPSAGITIATAIVSVVTGRPVHRHVALTGEITLRGDVLPIGGLKEKVLAAKAAGIRSIVLPSLNRRDLDEIADDLKQGLDFHFVDRMVAALDVALSNGRRKGH